MQFQKFSNYYVVRLDKGEEIVLTLKNFCLKQNIKLGSLSAIGATDKVILALYSPSEKKFYEKEFSGDFEIAPLSGNITTKEGESYLHLHINITDNNFQSFGGHLKQAWVSATCEVMINTIDGEVDREFSKEIGLNLLKFT